MSSQSNATVLNLFKKVFADTIKDITPKDQHLSKAIPFSQKQRVGESYVEAIVLTSESGITFSASSNAFELNPAIAGTVAQTSVVPYVSVLPSIVPFAVLSRSVGSAQAFYEASKFIVRNNLKSHEKFQEIVRLYGQADGLLGYTSYFTGTYRTLPFIDGTGTLNGITFTNGINATTNNILLAPGTFAAGIWTGFEGVKVLQVNSSGTVLASGKLVSVNTEYGYITVDFTPVAATSLTSTRICFEGMQDAQTYLGVNKILSTQSGNLFGINTSQYSLWQGATTNLNGTKLTLAKYQTAVANMVNKGGDASDLMVYLNPRSWATLVTAESALRMYDSSYSKSQFDNGAEAITFYSQNGKSTFVAHRMVKEGEAYALNVQDWSRSGSAEVSFQIPGISAQTDLIFPMQNFAGYLFRSYSDQYLFCHAPAHSIYIYGINDEAAN